MLSVFVHQPTPIPTPLPTALPTLLPTISKLPTSSPTKDDTVKLDMALELYGERKAVCFMALNQSSDMRTLGALLTHVFFFPHFVAP